MINNIINLPTTTVAIVQIIFQGVVTYLSYKIYQYNRLSKAWLAVTAALFLMMLRRIGALLITAELIPNIYGPPLWIDRFWLPFIITSLLVWGLWSMYNQFKNFDLIQKKAAEKAQHVVKRGATKIKTAKKVHKKTTKRKPRRRKKR
jgi:hypothetical protein